MKNRPALTKGPSTIKDLIKRCWQTDKNKRPTFKAMQEENPWVKAKQGAAVNTDKTIQSLLDLFTAHSKNVKFGSFAKRFGEVLSESQRLFMSDEFEGPFDSQYIRVLIEALNLESGRHSVNEDSVRRLINWVSKCKKTEILDLLYSFLLRDYFFGFMEEEEVRKTFSRDKAKPGSYIVRWSNSLGCFVLDYIPKKGKNKDSKDEAHIESTPLREAVSIQDVESSLTKVLADLSLEKGSYLPNRSVKLTALKIKEKYTTSDFGGYHNDTNPQAGLGATRADLSGGTTISHYEFIL